MTFYLLAVTAYLLLTIFTSLKITKSNILSKQNKTINILLNALIPILWFYLISPVIFPKSRIMTKSERERLISAESGRKLGDEIGSSRDAIHL